MTPAYIPRCPWRSTSTGIRGTVTSRMAPFTLHPVIGRTLSHHLAGFLIVVPGISFGNWESRSAPVRTR